MAEEKKTTAKKTSTSKSTTAKKTTSKKVSKAEEVKSEVKAESKVVKEVKTSSKKGEHKKASYVNRLEEKYNSLVKDELVKKFNYKCNRPQKFNYKSIMQVPHLEKIVVNVGAGDAVADSKVIDQIVKELATITGQKPVVTKAKKSIANFKLREGTPIGVKVTLRGDYMYAFFDRLVSIALPRVRDFRGVSRNSFDGRGNYTLGIKEQLIFPEIDYDKISKIRGMDIVIVTTANSDEEAHELLRLLGMPFQR